MGWISGFHIRMGWMGKWFPYLKNGRCIERMDRRWFPYPGSARFQIQPGPGSNCSSITYNPHSAPFTITKQKLENSHNVYLPSLCIAFIAYWIRRGQLRDKKIKKRKKYKKTQSQSRPTSSSSSWPSERDDCSFIAQPLITDHLENKQKC